VVERDLDMLKQLVQRILRTGRATEVAPPLADEFDVRPFRSGSAKVRHLDVGSCNGCEIEIGACFSPVYDLEQFGIALAASPRHADAVLITGVVTKNMVGPFHRTIEATPPPKRLVAIGDCAISGGAFCGSYAVEGVPAELADVDIKVPGCPPDPAAIVAALRQFTGK